MSFSVRFAPDVFLTNFLSEDNSSLASHGIDSGALLRESTAAKEAGNMGGAIDLLRQFWLVVPFGSGYGVEAYLKLPMYLQQAGRRDEAWRALNELMTGYVLPTAKLNDECLPMMHSEIYDKMRLFWQREGESSLAVKYGILSHMHWMLGLHRQRRREEFRDCGSRETIEVVVRPLLKKAKHVHLMSRLCDFVEAQVRKLPALDVHSVGSGVDQLVLAASQ